MPSPEHAPPAKHNTDLPYVLLWLRLGLLIRAIRTTMWDDATWPTLKQVLKDSLQMQSVMRRRSWWNGLLATVLGAMTVTGCGTGGMEPPPMRVTPRDPNNRNLVGGDWTSISGPVIGLKRCIYVSSGANPCAGRPAGETWSAAILDEPGAVAVMIQESASTRFTFYLGQDGLLHGGQQNVLAGGRVVTIPWVFKRSAAEK
jgi:hypothetical protein